MCLTESSSSGLGFFRKLRQPAAVCLWWDLLAAITSIAAFSKFLNSKRRGHLHTPYWRKRVSQHSRMADWLTMHVGNAPGQVYSAALCIALQHCPPLPADS